MCAAYFLVCDGGAVSNWWSFSRNLAIYGITALQMNDSRSNLIFVEYSAAKMLSQRLCQKICNVSIHDNPHFIKLDTNTQHFIICSDVS